MTNLSGGEDGDDLCGVSSLIFRDKERKTQNIELKFIKSLLNRFNRNSYTYKVELLYFLFLPVLQIVANFTGDFKGVVESL